MSKDDISRILIIQSAYIGDVILTTPLLENIRNINPRAQIDVLIKHSNASVLTGHPYINQLLLWNKKEQKNRNLLRLLRQVRANRYDVVLNCHGFTSSGILTVLSRANYKVGFSNNPLAKWYDIRVHRHYSEEVHEVDRILTLLEALLSDLAIVHNQLERKPKLYPKTEDELLVSRYRSSPYICIAPASVWFTKQFPSEKWIRLINTLPFEGKIYLLGSSDDRSTCENIKLQSQRSEVENLAGEMSLLQSALLMRGALLNYVNDSAPLHLASAVDAPVCAIFCSTVPFFGFTPLANFSEIVEVSSSLYCRPCGKHGHRNCPEKHFRCANEIQTEQLINAYEKALRRAHRPSQ